MKRNTKSILSFAMAFAVLTGAHVTAYADGNTMEPTAVEQTQDDSVIIHRVKEGETLGKIAEMYYGNAGYWEILADYNHMDTPSMLFPGDLVRIPRNLLDLYGVEYVAPTQATIVTPVTPVAPVYPVDCEADKTYTVKEGDTLYCIVRVQYGLTNQEAVDKLATYNNLSDPNKLSRGQVLYIPCVEKLQQVVQNDYTQQYNEMGWRLYHQEHPCQPQVCPPNPCDYQWVWWPVCPQPVVPEHPCGEYRPPCPPPAPECGGPRLVYRP